MLGQVCVLCEDHRRAWLCVTAMALRHLMSFWLLLVKLLTQQMSSARRGLRCAQMLPILPVRQDGRSYRSCSRCTCADGQRHAA